MKKIILYIIAIFTLISCERELVDIDDVNFSNNQMQFEIAIDGFISTEKTRYRIVISKPVDIHLNSGFIPINNAEVSVSDGDNTYLYEIINAKGVYRSIDSIQAIPGQRFTLKVVYNGNTYTASDIAPTETPDEIYYIYERSVGYDDFGNPVPPNDSSIGLNCRSQIFGYDKNLVISAYNERQYYFILDSLSDISYINRYLSKIYMHKSSFPQGVFPITYSYPSIGGAATDTIVLINMGISDNYHEYLISLFNITDWNSGLFSTISGNVKTNISEGGIGYFYIGNVKRIRVTVKDLLSE